MLSESVAEYLLPKACGLHVLVQSRFLVFVGLTVLSLEWLLGNSDLTDMSVRVKLGLLFLKQVCKISSMHVKFFECKYHWQECRQRGSSVFGLLVWRAAFHVSAWLNTDYLRWIYINVKGDIGWTVLFISVCSVLRNKVDSIPFLSRKTMCLLTAGKLFELLRHKIDFFLFVLFLMDDL